MKIYRFLRNNLLFTVALSLLIILLLLAFFGKYLPFVDADLAKENYRMENGIIKIPPYEPSKKYWFGTDDQGRDLFSVIILSAKETLFIVLLITILRYLMAIPLSFLAHKKIFGMNFIVKSLNTFFSYVPTVIIVIMFALLPPILFTSTRPIWLIAIIAFVEVGRAAATLKDDFDALSVRDYMESGVAVGAGPWKMLRSYYLPFVYEKLAVYMISDLGKVMFLLGQLGFIGIFISQALVQVDMGMFEIHNISLTWPMLLENAFLDIRTSIWIAFWPAFAMAITIFIFNMLAQGLQQVTQRKDGFI